MRVLCVDDDRASLALMLRMLDQRCPQDEILGAGSGEEALRILESEALDLVVTDLVMPGMSGIDLVRRLQGDPKRPEFIVLTGHSSVDTAVEAMKLGALDYLSKPINFDLITEKLEQVRHRLTARRDLEALRLSNEMIAAVFDSKVARAHARAERSESALREIARIVAGDETSERKLTAIGATLDASRHDLRPEQEPAAHVPSVGHA